MSFLIMKPLYQEKPMFEKKSSKTKKSNAVNKTYHVIILDQSGSMGTIRREAIGHVNEVLDSLHNQTSHEIKFCVTLFNDKISHPLWMVDPNNVSHLTNSEYAPSGYTRLLDAIGLTIRKLEEEVDDLDKSNVGVLFSIVTDGHENDSKEYTQNNISKLIEERQSKNWTFTFLGAEGIKPYEVARALNINLSNVTTFIPDVSGMNNLTRRAVSSSALYYAARDSAPEAISVTGLYEGDNGVTSRN